MQFTSSQTKQCPFCAETILAAAVKCRFCGEFLNTEKALRLGSTVLTTGCSGQANAPARSAGEDTEQQEPSQPPSTSSGQGGEVFFSGQPSLWVMAGAFLKGGIVLAAAVALLIWHIERMIWLELSAEQAAVFGRYRLLAGAGLGLLVVMVLFYKAMQVRMTYYKVSADRIEFGKGIFDRKVDNLDMFRVVDLKLRRSFLDCIVGVGTVLLTTTDKSHPDFVFEKVRGARQLYDTIKKATLSADRKTNVIHVE
jgi:membrane protein YdbS with pleckstrin-like domain